MNGIEYCLYLAKAKTDERHHHRKSLDIRAGLHKAWGVLQTMRSGTGSVHRLHHGWATHLELWEIHPGDHGFSTGPVGEEIYIPVAPDRLIATAEWEDRFLTIHVSDVISEEVRTYAEEWDIGFLYSQKALRRDQ